MTRARGSGGARSERSGGPVRVEVERIAGPSSREVKSSDRPGSSNSGCPCPPSLVSARVRNPHSCIADGHAPERDGVTSGL